MQNQYAASFKGFDYLRLDELLSDEQRLIRDTVREWVTQNVSPIIEDYAERAEFPAQLVPGLGSIGAFGPYIPQEYGGAGLDLVSYGLIMQELERGDSGVRSCASVQSSLVMYPIWKYGSEDQKQRFLPRLAKGEILGCFGLTEPNHGSDPSSMECRLKKIDGGYLLNGAKMWITNSPVAEVAVVWAKDENGQVLGVLVERGMKGFSTPTIHGKWSLRASLTGELVFEDVEIPEANVLPNVRGLKGPLSCLTSARYGIAWGALGAAMDCLHAAVEYSKDRKQFGKPLAAFQLTQKKLAEMLTDLSKGQLLALRLGQLNDAGKISPALVSMGKRNNVELALRIARDSRQILGAMGITQSFPMMRHAMNLESVITYEGTHEVHLLITGMDLTGENAFS